VSQILGTKNFSYEMLARADSNIEVESKHKVTSIFYGFVKGVFYYKTTIKDANISER